jgi:hypothetical protein
MVRSFADDPELGHLRLVGLTMRETAHALPASRRCQNLTVVDSPPDVRPHLLEADAALMPIFAGSGTRLKAVEAVFAGLPLVASRKAVEGLDLDPVQDCALVEAATPEAVRAAVRRFAERREHYAARAAALRERWLRKYDWPAIGGEVAEKLRALATGANSAPRTERGRRVIEMSRGEGVVRRAPEEAHEVPLPPAAFHALAADALGQSDRRLWEALAPDSPRLAGAAPAVCQAAALLRPFLVEALSYLRVFEQRFVHEGATHERAPVDFRSHVRRYAFTLALVRARAARFAGEHGRPARLLDVGGAGVISGALRADEHVHVSSTSGDLRTRFATGRHDDYDIVLCSEVVEHVADPEVGYRGDSRLDYNAEVTSSGARNLLATLSAVLSERGELLLTTPNALSLYALRELGQRRPPVIYRPHYREYTPRELVGLVRDAGLEVTATTLEVYAFNDMSAEMEHLARVGAADARRFWGDTTVAFAWKGREADGPGLAADLEALTRAFVREDILAVLGLDALVADRLP